jgi:hypothetical protein
MPLEMRGLLHVVVIRRRLTREVSPKGKYVNSLVGRPYNETSSHIPCQQVLQVIGVGRPFSRSYPWRFATFALLFFRPWI